MKIGINVSFLRKSDTGTGQITRGFVKELIKSKNHKHDYFLYLEKDDIELKLPKNFHKRVFLPSFWKRDDLVRKIWWEKFSLPQKVKRDKCDLFISLYPCPTFLPKNTKHTMIIHDMIWKVFPEYLDNWRKKLYTRISFLAAAGADRIVTVSNWSKRDIHKYLKIPLDHISIAYPSVDDNFFEEIDWDKDNKTLEKYGVFGRYIFYIGGFDFRKNVRGLLRAYRIFLLKYDLGEINLILGGEDKSARSPLFTDAKKEIQSLGLEEKVKLAGFIEQQDLPALYRHAELFILPTFYEGFGLMALEAMASGTPAAVSKSSSLPEVCGDSALYFNPYDEIEMARVMAKIIRNEKLKKSLSEKGKERAKKFTWESFVETMLEN